MEKNNAAEEAFKAAIADLNTSDELEKLVQSMQAETKAREDRESFAKFKEEINNPEPVEPKPTGGFATICVLGAAAIAVAVPFLINKFKKKD